MKYYATAYGMMHKLFIKQSDAKNHLLKYLTKHPTRTGDIIACDKEYFRTHGASGYVWYKRYKAVLKKNSWKRELKLIRQSKGRK